MDGKTLRRSYNREDRQSAIHMVNAFSVANGVLLGQIKTDDKSNEITAIPELLNLLDIEGALVSIDAMGTQADIAHTIVEKSADFLLAVKANQESVYQTVKTAFDKTDTGTSAIEQQKSRVEYREALTADASSLLFDEKWPAIKTVGKIISYRLNQGKETLQYRYYISSAVLNAQQLADAVRCHWAVENQLHWVLDVSLKEDDCQIYRGHGAENLARLRQATVNILKKRAFKPEYPAQKTQSINGSCLLRQAHQRLKKVHALGLEVSTLVYWLTDVSKPEGGNRAIRKSIDLQHTKSAPFEAHIIKLADLIENTSSIVKYDKKFAKVYLREKSNLLDVMMDEVKQTHIWKTAYANLAASEAALYG